ncbi:MAG: hypothetical protein HYR85_03130 [Planctomycetes bacterium]|nr:hypothetical protein [Planctomycetota bacterium]
MSRDRWPLVTRLFHEALERDASERGRFLDEACGGDAGLRHEVESLLDADASPSQFIEPPTPKTMGGLLAQAQGLLADGERVGPWQVDGRVAAGGMGVVYRAHRADGEYDQAVALKVIGAGVSVPEVLARFRIERQTLARLDHAHIARLVDGGVTSRGLPYLAMEFVDGKPIAVF